jgi:uncharacterized repeat protein (TIGR01451 family)
VIPLLVFALLLGAASAAQAVDCSEFPGGVIDGFTGISPPSQIQIDRNCTIRNFPASNPLGTNFSFLTQPGQTDDRWLVVFDNVVHTGQMACNSVAGHIIWFTNGSSTAIQEGCQNLLIPVEKIDKQNPAGQTTAAIGVPFTYTLTIPVLFDAGTGTVINSSGSPNDVHSVTIWDDLNATGADLTYLGHTAYWRDSGAPVQHTFSNVGGFLTFEVVPVVPAGDQIVVEIEVVLDDTPANTPGTQFVNTAKWDFGRLIDGVFYEPLPGEWGITQPLTIAAPYLVATKTGPATLGLTMNLGQWGEFAVDVQNVGLGDAWDVTLRDLLPDGASGGMCDAAPEILSAQVFASDGVSSVPGKGPLVPGADFSLSYSGAPSCELTLTMLTPAGVIGPTERLIVTYRTQLDADSQDGATLTNVAGATQWFNGDGSNPDRVIFTRTLTDGSVGVLDHEDAHTVTVELYGYFFEKTVANVTSGVDPASTAAPGDTLRYTLRLQATDIPLSDLRFYDDLGELNVSAVFEPDTLAIVPGSIPPGADVSNTDPDGGTNGAGILDVRNLDIPAFGQVQIQFDITLAAGVAEGTLVTNQADLIGTVKLADSDDPNVNGQADPDVVGDEDPTQVLIATIPVDPLLKEITQPTASVGEVFSYRITVPELPYPLPLYDVKILDDLGDSAADLRFVGVTKISGSEPWTPVNTGSATDLVIEDTSIGIDIPAEEQIVLEIRVVLEDTPTNATVGSFTNTGSFLYNWVDGSDTSQQIGDAGTSEPMTIVGPDDVVVDKSGPAQLTVGVPETYTLDAYNAGDGAAWNLTLTDLLPDDVTGGTCDVAPSGFTAEIFDGSSGASISGPLVEGEDFSANFFGDPDCELTIRMLSPAAAIGVDQRLIVTYEVSLDVDSQDGAVLTNVAGATEWFSADPSDPDTGADAHVFTEAITDGSPNDADHQDAHAAIVALPGYLFEKIVANLTSGANPATTAVPGDRLHYQIRVENLSDTPLDDLDVFDELDRLNAPAAFEPGTLRVVSAPLGADASNTSDTGGAQGTGVLDVRGLSLPGMNDSAVIEFEITLAPVIADGTRVANQSELRIDGVTFSDSDDPNVNGPANPFVTGDEDPTELLIESAPAFQVQKVSADLDGDPAVLLAGETLRYTVTVKNIGTADAVDAALRDDVPVNTRYVPGSTTLNGTPVPDGPGGLSPLVAGIPLRAPEDPTPGAMRADASATPDNVATIVFDVVVDAGVADGTVISNQAFVSAPAGGVADQPSDDPRTPTPDDPTRDVVGISPLLFAAKDVVIGEDAGTLGIVDPDDVLHYTISVHNSGSVAATAAALQDVVPANTSYEEDSMTLNGVPVGRPDSGVFPLITGISIHSSDLTPPPGAGVINPGQTAVVEFDLRVALGVPAGTVISNQAVVSSAEVPTLLTDGDGNPATGPEPTIVVVGDSQQLSIAKQVSVVGGGAALAGSELEYTVRVANVAAVPASNVVITDDLDVALSYIAGSATLNGSPTGVSVVGSVITADYAGTYGDLDPGESAVLRFRASIDVAIPIGTTVTNVADVSWNDPPQTLSASASIDVGGMPGVGVLNGTLWHDADFDQVLDLGERLLSGWTVELERNGQLIASVVSDANGVYSIGGLSPNDVTGDTYALRFRAPGAGPSTAALGTANSPFTDGLHEITDIVVTSGANLQGLDLPIDPNGVVYGALPRTPVAGATLTLLDAGSQSPLDANCFDDPAQQGQVTGVDGYYKFSLNFLGGSCQSPGDYLIQVSLPGSTFNGGVSQIIPPTSDEYTAAFSVPTCPGSASDAVLATAQHCEVQISEFAPPNSVPAGSAGTRYHLHVTLDASQMPGSSQLFNNHIPLDPVLGADVSLSKTTPKVNVSRGDLVPYEIVLNNQLPVEILQLRIRDYFPAGFHYVEGSARVDGVPTEPDDVTGNELTWSNLDVDAVGSRRLALLLAVGAGVSEGEYTNRAQAFDGDTDAPLTLEAQATVRVVPDPTFDCTDVLGKVFDDANRNGIQDEGERGLPGVRLATVRGLLATTDAHGRYHITCAVVPREDRGSNFVLKLDDRTLPAGYRMTTRQVQVQRATRGRALRLNFGAAIHRVVGLDLVDAVFEPGSDAMREQWKPRIELLLEQLEEAPSILRLSYVADVEPRKLVERRLDAVKALVAQAWQARDGDPLSIETEVFWRRGGPLESPPAAHSPGGIPDALPSVDAGPPFVETSGGHSVERHLPVDAPFTTWSQDPAFLETRFGDKLEEREVLAERPETVKLANVVPPIRFESGVADIPVSTVERLRGILDSMQHLRNVRLHLVGHADDQPLSESLSEVFGDNEGLSRERAGEVAEFLQAALSLPPESISFEWAGASQPMASNDTPEGRALNRRVEVEVWHDVIREELALEEVVVSEEIKRVKVCRTETVCKLRYRDGNGRRARLRNLIQPLYFGEESVEVSAEFIRQIDEALHNLRHKQNVTVRFIGFTDDALLEGRAARIYGTHLALSKARSRRAALAVQDALDLPSAAVESNGRGTARPVASNATPEGRALNRRVEVEFWYDDALQELPDEPQPCPDAADAESVTVVYDPPWGRIEPLSVENGEIRIPAGYADDLQRAMADVAHETRARLRFVGYTRNERLDRRTALVYEDDIGLSSARARRARQQVQDALALSDEQVEHEGRGYVHSHDVVNAGFLQGESDHVVVQVVYDELALLDEYEGVEVTPITREIEPKDPLALNPMRITIDGEPIDDPGRSRADIQRCTDVALERADIRFRFDDLAQSPRLSVTSAPTSVPVAPASAGGGGAALVRFRTYSNYPHFIERSEVRIFDRGASLQSEPLAVAEVDAEGFAQWRPDPEPFPAPVRELKYVLRAYDAEGRFDETAPQVLWMMYADPAGDGPAPLDPAQQKELLAGYGESERAVRNIPLDNVGTVKIHGSEVPPGHTVWVAGAPVPTDEDGNFVAETLLPAGMHTVEVAVLDEAGNGELFLRDLEFGKSDWFYMGIADLTVSGGKTSGPADLLEGGNAPYDRDSHVDGRLAFYLKGKFAEDWKLTASADTREEPVEDLFSNFLDKSPEALFRRIDPDYYYPTFGDDSTVEETAPTLGKFYVKLSKDESYALWGSFKASYLENELAQVDRGLYGAELHYQTLGTTRFGEQRLVLDGFAADPGTVPSREEFRGTGGSLYFLQRQDLLIGSERVRIEVRDKDSGLVTSVVHLRYGLDYDIDYFQGRIVLSEPLSSTVDDDLLVRTGGLSGNEAWLVVQYEFTPGLDEIDTLAAGGSGQLWLNDFVKLGVTANRNDEDHTDSSLYGADVTLRASANSWLKVQAGRSEGLVSTAFRSDDGGFNFDGASPGIAESDDAYAYRADLSVGLADFLDGVGGRLSVYAQRLEQGYSAPGQLALSETDNLGGTLELPLTRWLRIGAKADWSSQDSGLEKRNEEVDVAYQFGQRWKLSAGVRNDKREDDSPLVPQTQEVGERTDGVLQLGYDTSESWRAYVFGQATLRSTENRSENNRAGVGGAYRISDWLSLDTEVSYGDLGLAAQVGTSYQQSERTRLYLTYALENERALNGVHARMGNLVTGARTRLSDSGSVFVENRYQHASTTGLTRAVGMDLAPTDRLSLGANWESGELYDRITNAETQRQAGGASIGYRFDEFYFSSGVEYRFDETEQSDGAWTDRRTWFFRNNLKMELTPNWRLLGKFNHAISDSSLGSFFDGGYTEGVLGYAYRPVDHDRLNALAKYTYFYNVPTTDQLSVVGTPAQFVQKSHIASLDVTYDLFANFTLGGKYAYRLGQVSLDREDPDFFDNSAHLYVLRGDLRFLKNWETSAEGRLLRLPDLDERRSGALVTLYRYLGDHLKVGVGYNFTDFSDDLTDLSYDHQGWFFNIVGTL